MEFPSSLEPCTDIILMNHSLVNHNKSLLKTIVINCQSLKSKQAIFGCCVDTHNPNIIFGIESWLFPSISSSEGYCGYRQDQSDGYGGVFLACCNKIISREISITTQCEIVTCHITLAES